MQQMLRMVKSFAVVDFRQTRQPRNYLSRREQWRLLVLVMSLGLVALLTCEARDPRNWAWLFAFRDDRGGPPSAGEPAAAPPAQEAAAVGQSGLVKPANLPDEEPPRPAASSPREMLRLHGLDDTYFQQLSDGRPLSDEENETLLRVMFWSRDFSMLDLEHWASDELDLARLVEDPGASRGRMWRLAGRVTRVETLRLAPEAAERLELGQYYRCKLLLDDRQQPAVVFAASVPRQWPQGVTIDERTGAFGLFLKLSGSDPDRPLPVFVTRCLAWYPPTLLGNLGMDVALLDDAVDRAALGRARRLEAQEVARAAREREAFYALLVAAGRAEPGDLLRQAGEALAQANKELKWTDRQGNQQFAVAPLFLQPQQQRGRLVVLSGRARRAVRIEVKDPDVLARFGVDHYYEISLFTADSGVNPLVFCVRELPPGMPTGDGPEYAEQLRVAGFFFKLWSYPIVSTDQPGQEGRGRGQSRQPAPLLIGRQPVWYPREPSATSPLAGAIAGGLFVLALLAVWLALWRTGRGDRRLRDRSVARPGAIDPAGWPSGVELGDGAISNSAAPEETEEADRGDIAEADD
jgi:hypothetical protein